MKRTLIILCLILCPSVFAEEAAVQPVVQPAVNPLTVPQNIHFADCTQIFSINCQNLFCLTLAALSANKFSIDEIQTANGYIIFGVNRNKYLATIAKVDDKNSILKITPCNNIYNFPPGILTNTFKYIELNKLTEGKLL